MNSKLLLSRALKKEFLSAEEGLYLFKNTPTADLMWAANELRHMSVPGNDVTWQIDRNVNTTNALMQIVNFVIFFAIQSIRMYTSQTFQRIKEKLMRQ